MDLGQAASLEYDAVSEEAGLVFMAGFLVGEQTVATNARGGTARR
jgi:hypothetical protein